MGVRVRWTGFWDGLIAFLVIALCIGAVGFVLAWLTVLPTIGLLYMIGYL